MVPQCGLFNSFFFLVSKLAKPDESLDICSNKNKIRVISHKIWKIAFDNPILPICYYEDSIGCKTRASHGLHQTLCLIYWYTSWKKSHSIQLPKNMIFTSRAIKNVRHFKPWKILLLDQKKMSAKSPILDHYLSVEGYTVQEARNFLISCEILQFP